MRFVIFLFLLFCNTIQTVHAAEINQNCVKKGVCHYCKKESDNLQICAKCKSAKYCGRGCQKLAWPTHKLTCTAPASATNSKPVVAKPQSLVEDFWLGDVESPVVQVSLEKFKKLRPSMPANTHVPNDGIEEIVNQYITARGENPKILIVGCGKYPYRWTPTLNSINNEWQKTGKDGDHTHKDALTIAEDAACEPQIVLDFLMDLPTCMSDRFDEVYFEKLPPGLLAHEKIYINALAALRKGGLLVVDFQLRQSYIGEAGVVTISPFEQIKSEEYKFNCPDHIQNGAIKERFNIFAAAMVRLGFDSNIELKTVKNNKYNHRAIQTQVSVRK